MRLIMTADKARVINNPQSQESDMFKTLLKRMTKSLMDQSRRDGYRDGYDEACRVKIRERDEIEYSNMTEEIGTKVISCINPYSDPVFGIIENVIKFRETHPCMYVVKNALTQANHHCFYGTLHKADPALVEAILKLDSFERWNLSKRRYVGPYLSDNLWASPGESDTVSTPPDVLRKKLIDVGFL